MAFKDQPHSPSPGRGSRLVLVLASCLLTLILVLVLIFLQRQPFLLGFAGSITGEYSDLGIPGRNGVRLAVEDLNAKGGLLGRQVDLLVQDDLSTASGAVKADKRLIAKGATAIIGHMTSSQTLAALPLCDAHGVPLISPTASTPLLSGKKDLFFRVQPATDHAAVALAEHMVRRHELETFCIVWDKGNQAFTRPYRQDFGQRLEELGGRVLKSFAVTFPVQDRALEVARNIETLQPDGVFILASARDTAEIVLAIKDVGAHCLLASSEWARTNDLFVYGNGRMEGLHVVQLNSSHLAPQAHEAFRQKYQNRFGRMPSYASAQGYNAVTVYARAMEKALGDPDELPRALTGIADVPGLYGPMTLNAQGDLSRDIFISVVRDNAFVVLDGEGTPGPKASTPISGQGE
jgi:branched-chain amino acid transport system substrate-binding protein